MEESKRFVQKTQQTFKTAHHLVIAFLGNIIVEMSVCLCVADAIEVVVVVGYLLLT